MEMEKKHGMELTPVQREYLDTRLALILLENLFSEGKINEKTIRKIRKEAEKRLEKFQGECYYST